LVGGKIRVIRTHPTSHLFYCWVDILKIKGWQYSSYFGSSTRNLHPLVYWQKQMHIHQRDFLSDISTFWKKGNQLLPMLSPYLEWDLSFLTHVIWKAQLAYQLCISSLCHQHNNCDHHGKIKTCIAQLPHLWQHSNYQHNKEHECHSLFF